MPCSPIALAAISAPEPLHNFNCKRYRWLYTVLNIFRVYIPEKLENRILMSTTTTPNIADIVPLIKRNFPARLRLRFHRRFWCCRHPRIIIAVAGALTITPSKPASVPWIPVPWLRNKHNSGYLTSRHKMRGGNG